MDLSDPFSILLVEDNDDDVFLTKRAFKESKLVVSLNVATDGEEALDYLFKRGEYADRKSPDLVLLDLNLPKVNGKEVLRQIKEDDVLREIPVVILTTSDASEDIVKTYRLHANSYIRKPVTFERFKEIVQQIEGFLTP